MEALSTVMSADYAGFFNVGDVVVVKLNLAEDVSSRHIVGIVIGHHDVVELVSVRWWIPMQGGLTPSPYQFAPDRLSKIGTLGDWTEAWLARR